MLLGVGLLVKRFRKIALLGIIVHLIFTIFLSILNPELTFSFKTILTVHGEFVLKNLVLIAAALVIYIED